MCSAINRPVPDRVKPSYVIFDIRALWRSDRSVRVPGCQKLYKWRLNRVRHRMLYSCVHMAGLGVKRLTGKTTHTYKQRTHHARITTDRQSLVTDRQTDIDRHTGAASVACSQHSFLSAKWALYHLLSPCLNVFLCFFYFHACLSYPYLLT